MREYGSIYTRFWMHPDIQALSDQTKLLAVYLLTSPHTSMLGCFRLPPGYVAEDLGWSVETVLKGLATLAEQGFLMRDAKSHWLIIPSFLKWNPIENPNQGRCIEKLFEQVPPAASIIQPLIAVLQAQDKYLEEPFRNRLQTLSKQFQNPSERVSEAFRNQEQEQDQEQKQEQKQEQEQEQEQEDSIVAPARPGEGNLAAILGVFNFWKATLGHPQAVLDDKRKAWIRRALKSGYTADQLCEAIVGCSLTPHNMGKNDRGQRYDGLHVILKDADQIDRFIHNAQSPPQERNAAQALIDSNIAVCQAWLQDKLVEEEAHEIQ